MDGWMLSTPAVLNLDALLWKIASDMPQMCNGILGHYKHN